MAETQAVGNLALCTLLVGRIVAGTPLAEFGIEKLVADTVVVVVVAVAATAVAVAATAAGQELG